MSHEKNELWRHNQETPSPEEPTEISAVLEDKRL